MDREIIDRYIAISLAIKVFTRDQKEFEKFKLGTLYLDLLDSLINQLKNDFQGLKKEMHSKYHLDVKYLGKHNGNEQYRVNNKEIIEYTPIRLKELTKNIMEEYLYSERTRAFERKVRTLPEYSIINYLK